MFCPFHIVVPVFNKRMVCEFNVSSHIYAGSIHRGAVGVAIGLKVTPHPFQKVFTDSEFLLRTGRYAS